MRVILIVFSSWFTRLASTKILQNINIQKHTLPSEGCDFIMASHSWMNKGKKDNTVIVILKIILLKILEEVPPILEEFKIFCNCKMETYSDL